MFKLHKKCRACGSKELVSVANFGNTPLANDFQKEDGEFAGRAPLEVLVCENCTLGQLSVVVNPSVLYRNYSYVSSTSLTMQSHMATVIANLTNGMGRSSLGYVLEIGSNTGEFLAMCKPYSKSVYGIDPAQNLDDVIVGDFEVLGEDGSHVVRHRGVDGHAHDRAKTALAHALFD